MTTPWWINLTDEQLVMRLDSSLNEKGKISPHDYFDGMSRLFFYISGGLVALGLLLGWGLYATFETGIVFLFLIPFLLPLILFLILGYGFISSYFNAVKETKNDVELMKQELDRRKIFY